MAPGQSLGGNFSIVGLSNLCQVEKTKQEQAPPPNLISTVKKWQQELKSHKVWHSSNGTSTL